MSTSSPAPVLDASTSETLVRFHLSLNVGNLSRSQAFYRVLLDVEPAKVRDDYVKFELAEPPLVLSLIPGAHSGGGALNHVGVRLVDAEALLRAQARLEMAGYPTQREDGVACCYARQTKFWVADPDRTVWELYILHDDSLQDGAEPDHDHEGTTMQSGNCDTSTSTPTALVDLAVSPVSRATAQPDSTAQPGATAQPNSTAEPVTWFHNLAQPLPEQLDLADESVDEVQLQGTFNLPHDPLRLAAFLAEVLRVVRPGGRVLAHGLVAQQTPARTPALPGPAALVTHVPVEGWPAAMLAAAGLVNVHFTKLAATACFTVDGVELRECKVVGYKPPAPTVSSTVTVIYRGPFRTVTDDQGHCFARGQRVDVDSGTLALLKAGPLAEQFTILDDVAPRGGCGA